MKINHRTKYLVCVGFLATMALIVGLTCYNQISEKVAISLYGGPLFIYFTLARYFHAGEVFNIILLFLVNFGYLAVLLFPLNFIFRSFKWEYFFIQLSFFIAHLAIGIILAT
ncbi:MAG: hypothetical protein ACYTET_05260 [Planctomycetota bacterium]|jgi:hypothetical protein